MNTLKLILDFVSNLIWPATVLIIVVSFRAPLSRIVDELLSRAEQIDANVGGQKISIKLAKGIVVKAIETAVSETEIEKRPQRIDEIATETSEILSLLSYLTDKEKSMIEDMYYLPTSIKQRSLTTNLIKSLRQLYDAGLIEIEGNIRKPATYSEAKITDKGRFFVDFLRESEPWA